MQSLNLEKTADTLSALEIAKEHEALTLGICNVVGSSITRVTSGGVYTHAGPEIGVASTKAFTTQVYCFNFDSSSSFLNLKKL